ncbi:MAG TPA: hypothetical protein VG329_00505 [Candidatus Dormibacteraeota bacterium]|jgi:translation initiation factor 2B subunit (eIF-2B alpha/beta/delta family)|nr:hypothetical protein [Candidatus Dormibacteraeota bacterium]
MPAIGEIAREGAGVPQPPLLLRHLEAEHARVAAEAAISIGDGAVVATISNSSMVARVLRLARPSLVQVHVSGLSDEGYELVSALAAEDIAAAAVPVGSDSPAADLAVVGCDALFDDGGFVNRRGTADLVAAMAPRPTLVLGDRWRQVPGATPPGWPEADAFEVVPPRDTVRFVY